MVSAPPAGRVRVHKSPSEKPRPPHPPGHELGDAEDQPAAQAPACSLSSDYYRSSPEVFKWTHPRPILGPAIQPIGLGGGSDARASGATSQLHPRPAQPPQARGRRRQHVFIGGS